MISGDLTKPNVERLGFQFKGSRFNSRNVHNNLMGLDLKSVRIELLTKMAASFKVQNILPYLHSQNRTLNKELYMNIINSLNLYILKYGNDMKTYL